MWGTGRTGETGLPGGGTGWWPSRCHPWLLSRGRFFCKVDLGEEGTSRKDRGESYSPCGSCLISRRSQGFPWGRFRGSTGKQTLAASQLSLICNHADRETETNWEPLDFCVGVWGLHLIPSKMRWISLWVPTSESPFFFILYGGDLLCLPSLRVLEESDGRSGPRRAWGSRCSTGGRQKGAHKLWALLPCP